MDHQFEIYWEQQDPSASPLTQISSSFNNLFGFPYMTPEKISKLYSDYQTLSNSHSYNNLINPSIYFYLKSLSQNCADINLSANPITSPHCSSNILVMKSTELVPYKKIKKFWICLSPTLVQPELILVCDIEKILQSIPDKIYMAEFTFQTIHQPDKKNVFDLRSMCQVTQLLTKVFVCKPNGQFIEYYSYPDSPVICLLEFMKSVTGYSDLKLVRRLKNSSKLEVHNTDLLIQDVIQGSQNLIFCERDPRTDV